MKTKVIINRNAVKFAALLFILFLFTLVSCNKDDENDNPNPLKSETWETEVTFNITEPAVYSFLATGDVNLIENGGNVTITGSFTIGDLTYEDLEFQGEINGDMFTLITTNYQVQYEFNGTTYTEDVTLVVPPFLFTDQSASGSGDIEIVTNPGSSVESGTISIAANKKN